LQRLREGNHLWSVVEFPPVLETAGPRVDGSDRVRRGWLALLVLPVVPGHRAVGSLGLDRLAIRRHQNARHQPERAEALGDGIGLHIAVIVLASPDVSP